MQCLAKIGATVFENVMELRTNENQLTEQQARAILGAFLFRKDDVHKPVSVLSGGEKSRLALARLLVNPPNLLLMDEPTTHLDIPSIDALIGALKAYEGTFIFISHDVHFIKALAENVLHVHSGRLTPYAGNYDYYLEKSKAVDARAALTAGFSDERGSRAASFTDGRPVQNGAATPSSRSDAAGAPRLQTKPKATPNQIRKFREQVGQLEKKVSELERKQAEITAELEDPASYADKGKFHHLNRELTTIVDQIATATAEWEEAVTKLAEMEGA
jgi:ATP-binding cassette subfamily F protein 3